MRITDLLDKRSISLNETPKTKSEALDRIIDLMVASGKINDREAYREQAVSYTHLDVYKRQILYYICKKLKEVLFVRNKQKVKNVKEKIVKNDWINMKI